jgi:hypothetical protein
MSQQNSQLNQTIVDTNTASVPQSSLFSWDDMPRYLSGRPKPQNSNEVDESHEEEEAEKESMICSTVRSIRMKYLERQLVGKIFIRRVFGLFSTAVSSDVTSEDIANYFLKKHEKKSAHDQDPLVQAELTGQYWRALSTVDTLLNSLERRSLAYSTADFGPSTILTRGTTIGMNDPFFHIFGFSFTLELSATAHSLIASRRRYEATREIALSKKREDSEPGILSQMNPFSYFGTGKNEETKPEMKVDKKV